MVAEELVAQVDTYIRVCQRKLIIDNLAEKCLRSAVLSRNALIRCARMKKAWILEERSNNKENQDQRNLPGAAKNHDAMEIEEQEEEKEVEAEGHFGQTNRVVISLRVGTAHQGNPPAHPVAEAIPTTATATATATTTTSPQILGETGNHKDSDADGDDAMTPVPSEGQKKAETQSEDAPRMAKNPQEVEVEEEMMMEELLCSGRVSKPPYAIVVTAAPCSVSPAPSFSSLPPLPFPTYPSPSSSSPQSLKRTRSEAESPDDCHPHEPQQPQRRTKRSRSLGDTPATITTFTTHQHRHHHPQQQEQPQKPVVCSC